MKAPNPVTNTKYNHNATQITIKRFNVFGMSMKRSAWKDYAKMPNMELKWNVKKFSIIAPLMEFGVLICRIVINTKHKRDVNMIKLGMLVPL